MESSLTKGKVGNQHVVGFENSKIDETPISAIALEIEGIDRYLSHDL